MEKLTAVIYNDYGRRYACLFLSGTNICKNGIVQSPNPYDTDLPVISDRLGAFVFFFFRIFFGLERGEWSFLLLVVVVGILIRDV